MISQYGDTPNVPSDAAYIRNLIDRQGPQFLLDCLAEYVGEGNARWKLSETEAARFRDSLIKSLTDAINERI